MRLSSAEADSRTRRWAGSEALSTIVTPTSTSSEERKARAAATAASAVFQLMTATSTK